jgi:hypothetical protein
LTKHARCCVCTGNLSVLQEYIMNKLQKQLEKLGSEKGALQRERSDLQKQCGELAGAVDKLNKDKVSLCWLAALQQMSATVAGRAHLQWRCKAQQQACGAGVFRPAAAAVHACPVLRWCSACMSLFIGPTHSVRCTPCKAVHTGLPHWRAMNVLCVSRELLTLSSC